MHLPRWAVSGCLMDLRISMKARASSMPTTSAMWSAAVSGFGGSGAFGRVEAVEQRRRIGYSGRSILVPFVILVLVCSGSVPRAFRFAFRVAFRSAERARVLLVIAKSYDGEVRSGSVPHLVPLLQRSKEHLNATVRASAPRLLHKPERGGEPAALERHHAPADPTLAASTRPRDHPQGRLTLGEVAAHLAGVPAASPVRERALSPTRPLQV